MENKNLETEQLNQCHSGLDPESQRRQAMPKAIRKGILNQVQDDNVMEHGRSMVEMLGVLAVIGVLTIMGIMGFRYAMNKHYANQTVERLMRRAVVVAGQANFGQTLSLHEFDENDGEYPITLLDRTDNESFTMQADNVPNEVCQQIVGLDWKLAKIIPENCSDTSMKFKFLNDLTDCSDCQAESVNCPPENQMNCGSCSVVRGFLDNDDDCINNENGTNCVRGKCLKCPKNYYERNDNKCYACSDDGWWFSIEASKYNCLGIMYYYNGTMRGCQENDAPAPADKTTCIACKNRCYYLERCRLIDQAYQRNIDGTCACSIGYFQKNDGCYACSDDGWWSSTEANKHNCLKTMFFASDHNRMIGCVCNDLDNVSGGVTDADETSCKACANRCYLNGTCYLAGEGQTYRRMSEQDGTCVANE